MKESEIVFHQIAPVDNISEVIEEVFGVKLDIAGGWGYDYKAPLVVHSLDMPEPQFLNMFANIRANVEMNLTLEEDDRYGGINIHLISEEQFEIEKKVYKRVSFEITAMKERDYAEFIQEYKDNYGKNSNFDLDDHFKRRAKSTIKLTSDFWFLGL